MTVRDVLEELSRQLLIRAPNRIFKGDSAAYLLRQAAKVQEALEREAGQ